MSDREDEIADARARARAGPGRPRGGAKIFDVAATLTGERQTPCFRWVLRVNVLVKRKLASK